MSSGELPKYGSGDIEPGDWIKYRSECYGCGRLAEVHGLGSDVHSGAFAVTLEGNVLFDRILEVRRRPLNVLVFGGCELGERRVGNAEASPAYRHAVSD